MSSQPPRHVNINIVACPHTRSYEEIPRDLKELLEAAVRRNPDMWKPPYSFVQRVEDKL